MKKANIVRIIVIGSVIGIVAGGLYMQQRNFVNVEIRSLSDKQITLVTTDGTEKFAVEPGKNRLPKGVYVYTLEGDSQQKSGLIAVNDATTIVLK